MPARTGCCKKCANIYVVSEDGAIVYRRNFYFDASLSWQALLAIVNSCGRDDNGNFMGLGAVPSERLNSSLDQSQDSPAWIVRAWNEDGDKTWDWSPYPYGFTVDVIGGSGVNSPFRGTIGPRSARLDRLGITVVSATKPMGQNWTADPPWQSYGIDDRMYGIDSDGNTIWDNRIMDALGEPYSLGVDIGHYVGDGGADPTRRAADFYWQFNSAADVVSVGEEKTLWRAEIAASVPNITLDGDGEVFPVPPDTYIIGGSYNWQLYFQVDNATGGVDWHMDWRTAIIKYQIRGVDTFPGNVSAFMGLPAGCYGNTPRFPIMALGADDRVWAVFRGPAWGHENSVAIWHYYEDVPGMSGPDNPYNFAVYGFLMELTSFSGGIPQWATDRYVVMDRIAHATSMAVSPDGATVAVLGKWQIGEDMRGFTDNYFAHTPDFPAGGVVDEYRIVGTPNVDSDWWLVVYSTADLSKISEFKVSLGDNNPGAIQYQDNSHIAVGRFIWTILPPTDGTGHYDRWRKWTMYPTMGIEQADGLSAWCGPTVCPANLQSDFGAVVPTS